MEMKYLMNLMQVCDWNLIADGLLLIRIQEFAKIKTGHSHFFPAAGKLPMLIRNEY